MSKIPVSVCIIAKNEEKYIGECLRRLKPYGFEIIVTDTGSNDRTREIAAEYADKVLDFEWINDFSAARNFCVANAANNWILILDCDEYVNSIDVDELKRLIRTFPLCVGVIRLKNLLCIDGRNSYSTEDVLRFFDRRHYRYVQPIHEQITYIEEEKCGAPMTTFMVPMEVVHHGYALSDEEIIKKNERNLALLYEAIRENPNDAYMHFQAAQSEKAIGHVGKAVEMYEKALALNSNVEYGYVEMTIRSLAALYAETGHTAEAMKLMDQYAPSCQSAKFTYVHANVLLNSGNTLKALVLYLKATILPDADTLGENLLNCYRHIIKIYADMGNQEMARAFWEKYGECAKERNRVLDSQE